MFNKLWGAKLEDGARNPQLFKGKEAPKRGIEPTSSAHQPNALPLQTQTGSE